jgi:folate-binding protein YgfZ
MAIDDEVRLLRDDVGFVDCPGRGVVVVSGPDTWSFLQSLVSQDVSSLGDGEGARSLLLHPQGKLDVEFRILRVGDDAWLDTDTGLGAQLAASLLRFRIRVKVEIVDRSADFGMLRVGGPKSDALLTDVPTEQHAHVEWEGCRAVRSDWPSCRGIDVIGSRDAIAGAGDRLIAMGVPECATEALEIVRVVSGVARQSMDYDDALIPQEAGLEVDAVSFTKGCFLGQELVCRIDTRGHVNRYLRALEVDGAVVPDRGTEIVSGAKVVGTVTSAVRSPTAGVRVLGFVRREIEPPSEVALRLGGASGSIAAIVRERPPMPS